MRSVRVDLLACAALALAAAGVASAAELGTLFHSVEERARLDRARRGEPDVKVSSEPARAYTPEVTGFVKRSDGRNTVWIDGRPVTTRNPAADPLFDPRIVRDLTPNLPDSAVTVTPESRRPAPR